MYSHLNQVLWLGKPNIEVTWELAESLSTAVIEEFESGVQAEAVSETEAHYGYRMTTLRAVTTETSSTFKQQVSKRPRKERPVVESNTG